MSFEPDYSHDDEPEGGAFLGMLFKALLVLAAGAAAWYWLAPPAWRLPSAARAAAATEFSEQLLPLQSTDGRTIMAKILVITDKTVFIRREDGKSFDLPLDRLTPESQQTIEQYRQAKVYRTGQKK